MSKKELKEILDTPFYPHDLTDPLDALTDFLWDNNVRVIQKAKWRENKKFNFPTEHFGAYCSRCGEECLFDLDGFENFSKFCPHCGAEMENPAFRI